MRKPRKPWGDDELAKLRAIEPGDRGAIRRLAGELNRTPWSLSNKLSVLRRRSEAADVVPGRKDSPFPKRFY